MAVIKAVNSRASLGRVIKYITQDEKTLECLIGGYNCRGTSALFEMKATKKAWNKTGGRQYKHFVQSFSPDEDITPQQAHEIAAELAESWEKFKGYEVIFATHLDSKHVHTHFVVNSVSFENGKKFGYSKNDLKLFKELSDRILQAHGLSICQKTQDISTYNIHAYNAVKKDLDGTGKSWLLAIALAVRSVRAMATNKTVFIAQLNAKGISVKWEDDRKYITFSDKDGHKVRCKKLTEMFKEDFSKEGLENDFRRNSQSAELAAAERGIEYREAVDAYNEAERRKRELDEKNRKSRTRGTRDSQRGTLQKRNVEKLSADVERDDETENTERRPARRRSYDAR